MKPHKGPLFFVCFLFLLAITLIHTGCANIVPPLGGPKDTLPPVKINVVPVDSAKNIYPKKIVVTFDEYIDPKDVTTELIVSPVPKVNPIVDAHLRTLTIKIKDTLQPNTTYSFDFGKAVRDVNEGNILRNFSYVFTTGNHIDRGTLGGTAIVANTGKADSTLIAMLYTKGDDSSVVKDRPRYIARTDSNGNFFFKYVQPGTYWIYTLKDDGSSHKYLSKAQLFGFADEPVVVSEHSKPVSLYAYAEIQDSKSGSGSNKGGNPGTGTNNNQQTQQKSSKKDKQKDRRLQMQINATNGVLDVLDTLRLSFTTGLKVFDSSQIRFTDDNFKDIDTRKYRWVRDSTNKNFAIYYTFPTDSKYNLIIPRTFGQDSANRKLLKDDTIAIKTKKNTDYGEITIRVLNLDLSRHPVLQFIQSDAIKHAYPFGRNKTVKRILFAPGEYQLRILYDTNDNGVWDPGSFFGKKRQPERVEPIHAKFTVKANWDNDWDITL